MGWNFFVVMTVLLAAVPAKSYPTPVDLDGNVHRWPITLEAPVVYYEVAVTDESLRPLFEEITDLSAELWSSVDTSILRLKMADFENPAQITVNFETSIAGGDMAAGYAVFDKLENGTPEHCSVHIAGDADSDLYNLSKTTLHEIGHCLGLGHSLVPISIMSYKLDQNSFALAVDDKAAITRLYPLDGSDAKLPPGCAIGNPTTASSQTPLFIVFLFAPLVAIAARKIMRQSVKN